MNEKILIKWLSKGLTQGEIAEKLKERGIKPCSLSSIEKYMKAIREKYKAKTTFHLAIILQREGLIE